MRLTMKGDRRARGRITRFEAMPVQRREIHLKCTLLVSKVRAKPHQKYYRDLGDNDIRRLGEDTCLYIVCFVLADFSWSAFELWDPCFSLLLGCGIILGFGMLFKTTSRRLDLEMYDPLLLAFGPGSYRLPPSGRCRPCLRKAKWHYKFCLIRPYESGIEDEVP